ncbi:MAG: GNAT family N-acetyltransferase [Rhodobacteraceae bacterium]|nr:GNAT family N-acetyltransferase [Paracoccaceae bacterium]MBR9822130.1 GNAT family N-acetyltransferase [Paracoccaceae bacterium]
MTALHLAREGDEERLLPMLRACHTELGLASEDWALREALGPILSGAPHGAIYIAGPARAPIGYAAISFGWSLGAGGLAADLDEIWVRPAIRGRGIGGELLSILPRALAEAGLKRLRVIVPSTDHALARLARVGGYRAAADSLCWSRTF